MKKSVSVALLALLGTPLLTLPASATSTAEIQVLAADTQPKIDRPQLDKIKADAAARGVPLAQALTDYFAQARTSLTEADEPDGPVDVPELNVDDLTAAELTDLTQYAQDQGLDLAQTIERRGWQTTFSDVAEKLEADFGAEFSGAAMAEDGSSAWFAFKGETPEAALALARTLPVEVQLQSNRGYSEAELAAASESVDEQLADDPQIASTETAYDIRSGTIEVKAILTPAAQQTPKSIPAPSPGIEGVRVEVTITDKPNEPYDNYVRGGGYLTEAGACTTGFNLKYATTDTKRLATAGHCDSASYTYRNHPTQGGTRSVKKVWTHIGKYGDIGYFTHGGGTATRTFYYAKNLARYATSAAMSRPAVGTMICKYGYNTGATCATVKYRNVTGGTWSDGKARKGLVQMNTGIAKEGDSGGPFYYGGKAYGLTTGGGSWATFWTPTFMFNNARDYKVWTK
ncbi:S1 family peptidase [Nonomuraea purpurea]|uniref:S1 family peptidase n=1 Tax=Nonomuraea purpurea TaxID=1849276 RepID=A0ABV8GGL4_9ACTN